MSLNIITKNIIKTCTTNVGLIQTRSFQNNKKEIQNISKLLEKIGRAQIGIVCLPEEWLPNNQIEDYNQEFLNFKNHSMTTVLGIFYQKNREKYQLIYRSCGQKEK